MKKQKEGEFLKKKDKACKFTEGKKVLTILAAIGIVLGSILGFVACNNNEVPQRGPDTGIVQPGGDEEEGEQGGNQGGNQGGETTKPDEGEEEKPNPDNPGGDIEQPEDPDQGDEDEGEDEKPNPDQGDEEEGKDPFVLDTLDELMEYKNETTYNYLNDNYMKSVVTKLAGRSATLNNAEQIEWAITGTEGDTITELQVRFVYHKDDGGYWYYVGKVLPKEAITVDDILDGNIKTDLNISREYSANTIEADMEKNQSLAEAIVTKLGGTLNDSDQLLFAMDNATNDPDFSIARTIHVKQITDTGVNEYKITINAANATGDTILEQLQKNLEADQYKNGTVEENVVTFAESMDGSVADIPEAEWPKFEEDEAASTASEAYRYYGKVETEDGSVVKLYVPEYMMNDFEQN